MIARVISELNYKKEIKKLVSRALLSYISTWKSMIARVISELNYKKEIKKLVSRALLSYISTWKFLRTLEQNSSPHFSRVLKNFQVLI